MTANPSVASKLSRKRPEWYSQSAPMKLFLAVILAIAFSVTTVRAADVTVKVKLATGPKDEPTTTFSPDTPNIVAMFETEGIAAGDKVRGVLVAEDVGSVAPANTKVLEKTLTLNEDALDGQFIFSKPTKGWPPGKYRVEIYVNDELATKAGFDVEGGGQSPSPAAAEESTSEIPEKDELKSLTGASLLSFGRAVKDKDFLGFYKDTAEAWQKQTTPEKLRDAFKDFLNKNIDLPSAIEKTEPVFNKPPTLDSNGVLIVQGYYPTAPNRVLFTLKYFKEEGEWKLVGVDVNLKE